MSSYKYTRRLPAVIFSVCLLTLLTVAVIAPSTASAQSAPTAFYDGTMTVGGTSVLGYRIGSFGSLSNAIFNHNGRRTIDLLWFNPSSNSIQAQLTPYNTGSYSFYARFTSGGNVFVAGPLPYPRSSSFSSVVVLSGTDLTTARMMFTSGNSINIEFFETDPGTAPSPVQSSDASLSALIISQGILTPTFNTGTYNYASSVENSVTSLSITATPTDNNAIVTGAGLRNLNVGANVLTVTVTAEDGSTTQNYTITVTREASGEPPVDPPVVPETPINPPSDDLFTTAVDRLVSVSVGGKGIISGYERGGVGSISDPSMEVGGVYTSIASILYDDDIMTIRLGAPVPKTHAITGVTIGGVASLPCLPEPNQYVFICSGTVNWFIGLTYLVQVSWEYSTVQDPVPINPGIVASGDAPGEIIPSSVLQPVPIIVDFDPKPGIETMSVYLNRIITASSPTNVEWEVDAGSVLPSVRVFTATTP